MKNIASLGYNCFTLLLHQHLPKKNKKWTSSVLDPGFRRGGSRPKSWEHKLIILTIFLRKLHEIKEFGACKESLMKLKKIGLFSSYSQRDFHGMLFLTAAVV